MKKSLKKVLGYSFAIAFGWAASFGSANAILVKGHIDPAFDASGTLLTNKNLGWSADLFVDVDPTCISTTSDGTCSASLVSATGTLYDTQGTLNPADDTFLGSLNFLSTPDPNLTPFNIDVSVDSFHKITGIDALVGYATVQPGSLPAGSGHFNTFSGNLWVQYFSPLSDAEANEAQLIVQALCPPTINDLSANLWEDCGPSTLCVPDPNALTAVRSLAADVQISVVPEPATALLLLGALAAGGIVRRRSA